VKALAILLLMSATAAAQPGADKISAAEDALGKADYTQVVDLAGQVVSQAPTRADLAEEHRLLGLAHFFLHENDAAEADFLAYLKLDLDGQLDPTTKPPEAVQFFEDVRARHAAELRALRPKTRRWQLLNLIPPGGQIQNGDRGKAIVIGGAMLVFAAADITSYALLRSWCSKNDFTCMRGGTDSPDTAKKLRMLNIASGIALIATYVYGVVDGFRGFHHRTRELQLGVVPTHGGVMVGAGMSF